MTLFKMNTRTTFIFNTAWADDIEALDDETRLKFLDAIIAYARYGEMPGNMTNMEMAVFKGMKRDIDANNDKYNDVKLRRSEAGKKSAEARKSKLAEQNSTKGTNVDFVETELTNLTSVDFVGTNLTNATDNDNDNVNVIKEKTDYVGKKENDDAANIDQEIALLKTQEIWLQDLERHHHLSHDNLIRWLDQFLSFCKADGHTYHPGGIRDAKSHFNNWLTIQLAKNGKQTTIDRRSRTNIAPGEIKDYSGSF